MEKSGYYNIGAIKRLLSENGIRLTKERGQNFLIDKNTLEKIILCADITPDDTVIEIGPGIGSLSHLLMDKCKKLILVEFDKKLAELLSRLAKDKSNIDIHHQDFLKTDISKIIPDGVKAKVCANIPYNITSKIIDKLIKQRGHLTSFTLTMQKEVAERVISEPGSKTYSSISILSQVFTTPKLCRVISPKVFFPQPKVFSAVVTFTVDDAKYNVKNEKLFFDIVHSVFVSRRKTIKNSLKSSPFISFNEDKIFEALDACGIDDTIRGEMLGIDKFVELSDALGE